MRRILSTINCLCLVAAVAGFLAPSPANTVRTTRTQRQSQGRPSTAPLPPTRRKARPRNFPPSITATRMTGRDENPPEEENTLTDTAAAAAAARGPNGDAAATSAKDTDAAASGGGDAKGNGAALLLFPTLLVKFAVVMGVKFATDVVVFPLLWLYRLTRLGKRKLMGGLNNLFGKKDALNGKVNGANGDGAGVE